MVVGEQDVSPSGDEDVAGTPLNGVLAQKPSHHGLGHAAGTHPNDPVPHFPGFRNVVNDGRAVEGDEEIVSKPFVGEIRWDAGQSEGSAVGRKGRCGEFHLGAVRRLPPPSGRRFSSDDAIEALPARVFREDLSFLLVAVRPPVETVSIHDGKMVLRPIGTEMVGPHIGRVEAALEPTEPDGITQAAGKGLELADGQGHRENRGALGLIVSFLAEIATAPNRDKEGRGSVALTDGERAGQMPSAVLVAEAVARELRQDLGLGARPELARDIAIAPQLVGCGEIQPMTPIVATVEGDAIGIPQSVEPDRHFTEAARRRVGFVQDVDASSAVVAERVKAGHEQPPIGRRGEEPHPGKALGRHRERVPLRNVEPHGSPLASFCRLRNELNRLVRSRDRGR